MTATQKNETVPDHVRDKADEITSGAQRRVNALVDKALRFGVCEMTATESWQKMYRDRRNDHVRTMKYWAEHVSTQVASVVEHNDPKDLLAEARRGLRKMTEEFASHQAWHLHTIQPVVDLHKDADDIIWPCINEANALEKEEPLRWTGLSGLVREIMLARPRPIWDPSTGVLRIAATDSD